jgi:DNA-binding transcriptional LysR family regulator
MALDWDKLRIFHAAAEAKSFTHAGDRLGLSQSAVSRQVSALEQELHVPLFHRHARGLILTEQGDLLFQTTQEVFSKLEATKVALTDSRERPSGELRVTATVGIGSMWLTPRLGEFFERFPEVSVRLILSDDELDLSMREADIAIRLRQPQQAELIQRRLFTVHFHVYAAPEYVARFGTPQSRADLDQHRLLAFGGPIPSFLMNVNSLTNAAPDALQGRPAVLVVNNIIALKRSVENGVGLGVLPDYMIEPSSRLVQVLTGESMPGLDAFLAYPEEMRSVARVNAFRDFLISKAQRWSY